MLINNVAPSWAQIRLSSTALGISEENGLLQGVSALKWNKTRKVEDNYGIGGKKVSRGFGNRSCTASIEMDYSTVVKLRDISGSLMDLGEFDLVISFVSDMGNGNDAWKKETIVLKGCIFNEEGFESKNDDTNIVHEYQLNPFEIITGDKANAFL